MSSPRARRRSTSELLLLLFGGVVALQLVLSMLAVIVVTLVHPDVDITVMAEVVVAQTTLLIGALLGYLSGRARSNSEETDQ